MRRSLTAWASLVQQLCDTNRFSQDIRKHLVNPLPGDCRMTVRFFYTTRHRELARIFYRLSSTPAILVCSSTWSITIATASYAGALNVRLSPAFTLHLSHPLNPQASSERQKPLTPHNAGKRRHSESALQPWVMREKSHLRSAFKRAVTITRVIIRLKSLVANKPKSVRKAHGPPTPRPRCGSCFCIYELLNSPLVISVSACSFNESTWEDRRRKGQGMTAVRVFSCFEVNESHVYHIIHKELIKILSVSGWWLL